MTNIYTADTIANWFLKKRSMSPKKLQKMLYYAYSWVLTLTNDDPNNLNNKLFNEKFEAWVHGPVIPSIYKKYVQFGYSEIPKYEKNLSISLPKDIEDILDQVDEVYGCYTANELESITHQEEPWKNARAGLSDLDSGNIKISDTDIFNCYITRVA